MRNWGVAAFLLATAAAAPVQAAPPPDLPLDKVTALLKAARIESAWSVAQFSMASDPASLEIVAHSGKVQLASNLCRTQETTLELDVSSGNARILHTSAQPQFAFLPCDSAGFVTQFHSITGAFEPERLATDVGIAIDYISACKRDPSTKLEIRDEYFRPYIGKLFVQDVYDVSVSKDGTVTVKYIAPILNLKEMGVTVEHQADGSIKLVVGLLGEIDVVPVPN